MASETLVVNQATLAKMEHYYVDYLIDPVPYSAFRARKNGSVITGYASGKVLFQGQNIEEEINHWQSSATSTKKSTHLSTLPKGFEKWTIIGSDEVGNGSYFGALAVCAVYVDPTQIPLLKEIGVRDSKQLSDNQIRDLAWQIKACVPYHLTVCPPTKYNDNIDKLNANGIKVSLHNFAIQTLVKKLTAEQRTKLQGVLIDQFTSEKNYLKYLKKEPSPYTHQLFFAQKGESEHIAVACASIIARAAFLESLEKLGEPYHCVLPSGAGENVNVFGTRLVKQFGHDVLYQTAKLHFANTKKILAHI